jgi:hydroxypyruvate isomerase
MLNFDVNVSMLWRELPFVERLQRAKDAGFDTVEFLWPRGEDLDAIAGTIKRLSLRVALHNMDGGDMAKGERGYANDPARRDEWRQMFEAALTLAGRVGCRRLNCLPGNDLSTLPREAQLAAIVENFRWALSSAAKQGVTLLIEPLNTFDSPNYPYGHTVDGLALIRTLDSPWVRLQYDVYHMERMEGRVAETIRAHVSDIAHIQIADNPGRHEPGTGQIDWRQIFGAIETSGYDGYIGLEYVAATTAEESLRWLPPDKRNMCTTSELNLWEKER